jgi:hypothetical protein
MDPQRKFWNEQQQILREGLTHPEDHPEAIDLFLSQHAMVHSAGMAQSSLWSFDDEIWQDLTEQAVRHIPRDCEHSIAWLLWHIARIEDITMNLLVAGSPQILHQDHCLERLQVSFCDSGNAMDRAGIASLSAAINIEVLRAYRMAVGRRTREVVKGLQPQELKQKVSPNRLQRVKDEGAVVAAAGAIIDYWAGLNIAGLLLMPPTRHNFVHLNEALRIKKKRS